MDDPLLSDSEIRFLEHVCLGPGLVANIFIAPHKDGLCLILVDATSEAGRIQAMQQKGNELVLCMERLRKVELKLRDCLAQKEDHSGRRSHDVVKSND